MLPKEWVSPDGMFVDEIVRGTKWWELDANHVSLLHQTLAHGKRDAGLFLYLLPWFPELVPEGANTEDLKKGAILHDISKAFPRVTDGDHNLWQRSPLLEEDLKRIQRHPCASRDIIHEAASMRNLVIPEVITSIALMHHERIDGSGYPFHLSGNQIPGYVQLFSVVDMIVSMREGPDIRPYRPAAFSPQEIRSFLQGVTQKERFSPSLLERTFGVLETNAHLTNGQLHVLGDWSTGDGSEHISFL